MSGDNLFAAEEDVVALGESLIANGSFDSAEDVQRYRQLLKSYRKLFRTTRRLMRLSDHNEQRFKTAAEELSRTVTGLRALGEVSQAVNSTLDLETVLTNIVAQAARLSGTEAGAIYVFDEVQREFHLRAAFGMDQALIDALAHQHIGLDRKSVV